MTTETILVTGGAGFIGSHLVERLLKDGHKVVVVDDLSTGKREYVPKEAIFVKQNLLNRRGIKRTVRKYHPTVVFHLAAQKDVASSVKDPIFDARVNIGGSLYLLEALQTEKDVRFIGASTAAVYSPSAALPVTETSKTDPKSPYGVSKLTMEKYICLYSDLFPISGAAIRPANVYGPRQSLEGAGVVTIMIEKLLSGEVMTIDGSGEQTRDFVYIDDVVDSMMRLMRIDWVGAMNISSNTETTINELYAMLQTASGVTLAPEYGEPRAGDLLQSRLDATRACQETGWRAQTSLEEGLKKTVEWFRERKTA